MASSSFPDRIVPAFPTVRGRLTPDAPLGKVGWFRTGGAADLQFRPEDPEDLSVFLASRPDDLPVHILGVLSNTIVRDGGVDGVVVRLGREFAGIADLEGHRLYAGAAALDVNVAEFAAEKGIAGLEFLSGVPGSIGGALALNAGAYGTEIRDVLIRADFLDGNGTAHSLNADELRMSYRHSEIPAGWIAIGAELQGRAGNADDIRAFMTGIREKRAATQPIRAQTGGSTFKNPTPDDIEKFGLPEGIKSWQLVDQVGGRGLMVGGAQMSELHANFMINTGTATAADLEALGEEIRRRVNDLTGYDLHWEIARIGRKEEDKVA